MRKTIFLFALLAGTLSLQAQNYPLRARLSDPNSFSVIVIPDPQSYTKFAANQPLFELQTAWIAREIDSLRILTALCTGNHDYGYTKSENRLSRFPDYFPMTRNECWRHKIVSVCNNAHGIPTLENAAYEFHTDTWGDLLVVSLEFAPRDEAIEWARKLVAEPRYANTRVILLTHSFIAWKGNRKKTEPYELTDANYQQAIWDKLVYPSSNIRLVICGHECHPTTDYFETVGFRTDKNAAGKSVAQMMFNAQTADGQWHGNGGDCWLRILEFLPDGRTVSVRTFSPMFALSPVTCDKAWRTADYDQFTFDME